MIDRLLFKNFVEKKSFVENKFARLSSINFDYKNSSLIIGKRNSKFFYKVDKLNLFLNEILYFYINLFYKKNKSLFFFKEELMFLFGREACLRSFQTILFGEYSGGIFTNNSQSLKNFHKMLNSINTFFFVFLKHFEYSLQEVSLLNRPSIILFEKNTKLINHVFYKLLFYENSFFFYYFVLKVLSDFLLKVQIYDYVVLSCYPLDLKKKK